MTAVRLPGTFIEYLALALEAPRAGTRVAFDIARLGVTIEGQYVEDTAAAALSVIVTCAPKARGYYMADANTIGMVYPYDSQGNPYNDNTFRVEARN